MDIKGLLNKNMIEIGAELNSKDEALDRLIEMQADFGKINSPAALSREIREREEAGSSAVSMRAAIPAVRHSGADRTVISAMTIRNGIEYGSPDKRRVRLIFMISGRDGTDEYIEIKSRIMHLLMDSEFTAALCSADSEDEFIDLIAQREKVRYPKLHINRRYDCSKYLIADKGTGKETIVQRIGKIINRRG